MRTAILRSTFTLACMVGTHAWGQQPAKQPGATAPSMDRYNVVWESASTDASGQMPLKVW